MDLDVTHDDTTATQLPSVSLVQGLAKAELDSLVATARHYPRSIKAAISRMTQMATLDEASAEDCLYSLPRGGKVIEGPSIRFAEMVAQSWGNNRVAARTTHIDRGDRYVEAEGVFLDAETNVATMARVRRRIVDKNGKLYNDDMILVTANAAQSIAPRNAILAGVPKQVWRKPWEEARRVIMGELETLGNRRAKAVSAFTRFGLAADQVCKLLGVDRPEDIDQERLVPLRGMYSALMNQEVTVEELLRGIAPDKPDRVTASTAQHGPAAVFAATVPSATPTQALATAPATVADPPADTPEPPKRRRAKKQETVGAVEVETVPTPATIAAPDGGAPAETSALVEAQPAPATVATPAESIVVPDDLLDLDAAFSDAKTVADVTAAWMSHKRVFQQADTVKQGLMTAMFNRAMARVRGR